MRSLTNQKVIETLYCEHLQKQAQTGFRIGRSHKRSECFELPQLPQDTAERKRETGSVCLSGRARERERLEQSELERGGERERVEPAHALSFAATTDPFHIYATVNVTPVSRTCPALASTSWFSPQ